MSVARAVAGVIAGQVAVGVPFAVAVDLHEAHAALDQPPGHQALGAEGSRHVLVDAIQRAGLVRLGCESPSRSVASVCMR